MTTIVSDATSPSSVDSFVPTLPGKHVLVRINVANLFDDTYQDENFKYIAIPLHHLTVTEKSKSKKGRTGNRRMQCKDDWLSVLLHDPFNHLENHLRGHDVDDNLADTVFRLLMQQDDSSMSSLVMFQIPGADAMFTASQLQRQLLVFAKQDQHGRMFVNIVLQGDAFNMLRETVERSPSLDSARKRCRINIARYAETLYQELDAAHKDAIAEVTSDDGKPPVDTSGDTECYDMDDDDVADAPTPPELQVSSVRSDPAVAVDSLGQTASQNFVQMTVGEPNPNDIPDNFETSSSPVRNDSGSRTRRASTTSTTVITVTDDADADTVCSSGDATVAPNPRSSATRTRTVTFAAAPSGAPTNPDDSSDEDADDHGEGHDVDRPDRRLRSNDFNAIDDSDGLNHQDSTHVTGILRRNDDSSVPRELTFANGMNGRRRSGRSGHHSSDDDHDGYRRGTGDHQRNVPRVNNAADRRSVDAHMPAYVTPPHSDSRGDRQCYGYDNANDNGYGSRNSDRHPGWDDQRYDTGGAYDGSRQQWHRGGGRYGGDSGGYDGGPFDDGTYGDTFQDGDTYTGNFQHGGTHGGVFRDSGTYGGELRGGGGYSSNFRGEEVRRGDFRNSGPYGNNLHGGNVYGDGFRDYGNYFAGPFDESARNGNFREYGSHSDGLFRGGANDAGYFRGYGNDDSSRGVGNYGGGGGRGDDERPPWDSFDRRRTAPRDPMRDAPRPPPNGILDGSTWESYLFKPHEEKDINPNTGSIYPWTGHSPDHGGIIVNYPVKMNVQDLSWRRYISDLLHGRYTPGDTKCLERFHKGFPTAKGSKLSLMDYLIDVVQHGKDWGLFIPPLHTLEVNKPLGFYVDHVPATHQARIPVIRSELAKALRDPKTGLIDHEVYGTVVRQGRDGYVMFSQLAALAGHPRLSTITRKPGLQRQKDDCSIADYAREFSSFLQRSVLSGQYYSDRYALVLFFSSVNRNYDQYFKVPIMHRVSMLRGPLPDTYAPSHLASTLLMIAQNELGQRTLASATPRELFRRQQPEHPIRQLGSRPDDEVLEQYDVEAVASSGKCHLCEDPGHYLRDCPLAAGVRDIDPQERARLTDIGKKKMAHRPTGNAGNHRFPRRVPNKIREVTVDSPNDEHTVPDDPAPLQDVMFSDAASVDSDSDSLDYVAPDFR